MTTTATQLSLFAEPTPKQLPLLDEPAPPADELLHAQRDANLAQVLVPTAKKQDRFVSAVKVDGRFTHR